MAGQRCTQRRWWVVGVSASRFRRMGVVPRANIAHIDTCSCWQRRVRYVCHETQSSAKRSWNKSNMGHPAPTNAISLLVVFASSLTFVEDHFNLYLAHARNRSEKYFCNNHKDGLWIIINHWDLRSLECRNDDMIQQLNNYVMRYWTTSHGIRYLWVVPLQMREKFTLARDTKVAFFLIPVSIAKHQVPEWISFTET